jgi:hypothetical protein
MEGVAAIRVVMYWLLVVFEFDEEGRKILMERVSWW